MHEVIVALAGEDARSDRHLGWQRCTKGSTRHNSADFIPTSNLVCIKEVAIRTTFCIAGIIYYTCNLITDIRWTRYKNAFNKQFERIVCQNKSANIYSEKIITVYNAVYFRLCIDLMHILPPVTAEGFDGSHHPRFAEWKGSSPWLTEMHEVIVTLTHEDAQNNRHLGSRRCTK